MHRVTIPFPQLRRAKSRLSRWTKPVRNAVDDYMQVAKDTGEYVKTHPYKATVMCVIGSVLTMTWRRKPDAQSYKKEVLWYSNEISQCSEQTRRKDAHEYVSNVVNMQCTGLLQHVNLGFVTLVVKCSTYKGCYNYPERCTYLQPKWSEYHNRVVDIGFWGQWWILNKQMKDFDVNEEDLTEYI